MSHAAERLGSSGAAGPLSSVEWLWYSLAVSAGGELWMPRARARTVTPRWRAELARRATGISLPAAALDVQCRLLTPVCASSLLLRRQLGQEGYPEEDHRHRPHEPPQARAAPLPERLQGGCVPPPAAVALLVYAERGGAGPGAVQCNVHSCGWEGLSGVPYCLGSSQLGVAAPCALPGAAHAHVLTARCPLPLLRCRHPGHQEGGRPAVSSPLRQQQQQQQRR